MPGLYAMIPFIVADLGNILGGFFSQVVIRRGVAIPRARTLAVSIFGLTMAAALQSGPFSGSRSSCSPWGRLRATKRCSRPAYRLPGS